MSYPRDGGVGGTVLHLPGVMETWLPSGVKQTPPSVSHSQGKASGCRAAYWNTSREATVATTMPVPAAPSTAG